MGAFWNFGILIKNKFIKKIALYITMDIYIYIYIYSIFNIILNKYEDIICIKMNQQYNFLTLLITYNKLLYML